MPFHHYVVEIRFWGCAVLTFSKIFDLFRMAINHWQMVERRFNQSIQYFIARAHTHAHTQTHPNIDASSHSPCSNEIYEVHTKIYMGIGWMEWERTNEIRVGPHAWVSLLDYRIRIPIHRNGSFQSNNNIIMLEWLQQWICSEKLWWTSVLFAYPTNDDLCKVVRTSSAWAMWSHSISFFVDPFPYDCVCVCVMCVMHCTNTQTLNPPAVHNQFKCTKRWANSMESMEAPFVAYIFSCEWIQFQIQIHTNHISIRHFTTNKQQTSPPRLPTPRPVLPVRGRFGHLYRIPKRAEKFSLCYG